MSELTTFPAENRPRHGDISRPSHPSGVEKRRRAEPLDFLKLSFTVHFFLNGREIHVTQT